MEKAKILQKSKSFKKYTKKGVDISMRLKKKKEALDSIAQKMANDPIGKYIMDLLEIASFCHCPQKTKDSFNSYSFEYRELLKKVDWLYGYDEKEIPEMMNMLKAKMEQKIFNRDSSYACILSCIACHCIFFQIVELKQSTKNATIWDNYSLQSESEKISECLDTLKRHCPKKINADGFSEARRYIRMWDSEYNW